MGRIADAALAVLAEGPRDHRELGDELARAGVTRSRDPGAAVRRALRDDPRVVEIDDGRLASKAQALRGVSLSVIVDADSAAAGTVDIEPDLAPLAMIGVGPTVLLPPDARVGEAVVVTVEDPETRRLAVVRAHALTERVGDEAALVGAVRARLGDDAADPVTHVPAVALGPLMVCLTAADPGAFRRAGRPLSAVLGDAGLETHLGWVGSEGTGWSGLTEVEAEIMEIEVEDLVHEERYAAAAVHQARLVSLLERHLPERVPAARRRWSAVLARGGRLGEALDALRPLLARENADPDDHYRAAVVALGAGDVVAARRLVQEGLARTGSGPDTETATCLADLAGDLDAQAAFQRLAERGPGAVEEGDEPVRIAKSLLDLRRSYLIEAAAEGLAAAMDHDELLGLIEALGAEAGRPGQEACLALAAVLPGEAGAQAWRAAGGVRATWPGVAGLVGARPVAAWATSPDDAPDQQQIILAVGKEEGRVAPLIALVDFDDLGGAVKDAFFLPDMAEARLRREVLDRLVESGLPPTPITVEDAVLLLEAGLATAAQIGWALPSTEDQPVLERIERWVLRPMRGDAGPLRSA